MRQNFKNVKKTLTNKRPYLPIFNAFINTSNNNVHTLAIPNAPASHCHLHRRPVRCEQKLRSMPNKIAQIYVCNSRKLTKKLRKYFSR